MNKSKNLEPAAHSAARAVEALARYHQFQGDTVRCADYSIAMAYNVWLDRWAHPELPEAQPKRGCDISPLIDKAFLGRFPGGSTTPLGINHAFKQLGIPFRLDMLGSTRKLRRVLGQGNPVVISIGGFFVEQGRVKSWGHVMVAVEYDPDRNEYAFLDPYISEACVSWMPEAELENKWWYRPIHPMWVVGERHSCAL